MSTNGITTSITPSVITIISMRVVSEQQIAKSDLCSPSSNDSEMLDAAEIIAVNCRYDEHLLDSAHAVYMKQDTSYATLK
ncbi:UNVERIFIED_CONTAM: hypothetical protein K2H54_047832 [Gekko kuhli]